MATSIATRGTMPNEQGEISIGRSSKAAPTEPAASSALRRHVALGIARLAMPHRDDGLRKGRIDAHHERSIGFLGRCGLVADEATRRYLDRARVAEGMAIALPDVGDEAFQLALDWTNHNCLHDDLVESPSLDAFDVASLSRDYATALLAEDVVDDAFPLVAAMVQWRRRAVALGVDRDRLDHFARRAARMASQFALERLIHEHGAWLADDEYLRQRIQDGPYDTWFALLEVVRSVGARPAPVEPHPSLATRINVLGNELRTCLRELDQDNPTNLILRATDREEAVDRLVILHNRAVEQFAEWAGALPSDRERLRAGNLARAIFATHIYELRSVRGVAWAPDPPSSPDASLRTAGP